MITIKIGFEGLTIGFYIISFRVWFGINIEWNAKGDYFHIYEFSDFFFPTP